MSEGGVGVYFEDLSVGRKFSSSTYTVSADEIRAFARQFDPQPFHVDEAAGRASIFGGIIASGWYTAAVTMRLAVQGGLPVARGTIGVSADIQWPHPVRPGDVLRLESEILQRRELQSRPDRGMITVRSATRNGSGATVQLMTAKLLVMRRDVL